MPFQRPTLTALLDQTRADVASALGLSSLLRISPERALSDAVSGQAIGLYGYLDWIALQSNPFTCTAEYLEAWAALAPTPVLREAATQAAGTATFYGVAGSVLASGSGVIRSDGVAYATTASGTVGVGGSVTVAIAAATAGAAGNAAVGASLTLIAAVAGINSAGIAATEIVGGADVETDDALRSRMLASYATPPQGGAASDYVTWAKQVAGVTRAWCAPNGAGAGTVVVYVMLDDVRTAGGGFPTGTDGVATLETRAAVATGDQLLVADYLYPLRPVTALVYVATPTATAINPTINDLNDAALRPAITTALNAMLRTTASIGGTIYPSDLADAIAAVPGVTHFSMPTPAVPLIAAAGHLHTLGTITWG